LFGVGNGGLALEAALVIEGTTAEIDAWIKPLFILLSLSAEK
jgi:hypothetical protein